MSVVPPVTAALKSSEQRKHINFIMQVIEPLLIVYRHVMLYKKTEL